MNSFHIHSFKIGFVSANIYLLFALLVFLLQFKQTDSMHVLRIKQSAAPPKSKTGNTHINVTLISIRLTIVAMLQQSVSDIMRLCVGILASFLLRIILSAACRPRKYTGLFISPSGISDPLRYSSRDGHAEGKHVNRGRDTPSFCPTLQVLDMLTSEGS